MGQGRPRIKNMANHMGQMLIHDFFCGANLSKSIAPDEAMSHMLKDYESWGRRLWKPCYGSKI
jgi:hypothetical protein